jgi:hypothetical protein
MIDIKKSGYIVETKAGKLGRTIHEKGEINGKIPVYIATKCGDLPGGGSVPLIYSKTAILCLRDSLKFIGFID